MKTLFDYIFYRVARFYYKWDNSNGITGIIAVTMVQALLILDLIIIISKFKYDRTITSQYAPSIKLAASIFFIVLLLLNFRKYYDKFHTYKKRWNGEEKNAFFNHGILVMLSLIIPWTILILIGIYW